MRRLEPNLLLAVSAGFALLLVVVTASAFGPSAGLIRNPLLAIICAGGFVLLNPMLQRRTGQPERPPMIRADAPGGAVWAALFPAILFLLAVVPILRPGYDYGLLVIVAAVMFGVTVESAIKARKG